MTNWLTLLDDLPKNKKALLQEKRYYDNLKSHHFYNLWFVVNQSDRKLTFSLTCA